MEIKGHAFVSKFGEGFTTLPELAQTVKVGDQDLPVLAPGITVYIRRHEMKRRLSIWDKLLDDMEKSYYLEEEGASVLVIREHQCRMEGLMQALSILGYGVADEPSIKLIQAQAKIRYEAES